MNIYIDLIKTFSFLEDRVINFLNIIYNDKCQNKVIVLLGYHKNVVLYHCYKNFVRNIFKKLLFHLHEQI